MNKRGAKKELKKKRPLWFGRLAATLVDLVFLMLIWSPLVRIFSMPVEFGMYLLAPAAAVYYLTFEWFAGCTPGKLFLLYSHEPPLKHNPRVLLRGLLRLVLLPLCMLSWRRVSLLDGLSGIRVIRSEKVTGENRMEAVERRCVR